jgi:molybdopterin-containing oxidoreductase family iron-sulfur binding subunit
MSENKTYYQHIQELKPGELVIQKEHIEKEHKHEVLSLLDGSLTGGASRRSFLKLAGFSTVLATVLSSCEKPIHKAIPYLIKPEEITPGKSTHYATTYFDGEEFCSILVKSRDGRPIKIEGNPASPLSHGGTSARVQASVLSLYDNDRYHGPLKEGKETTWETADSEISAKLGEISARGGNIVLLTSTVISPTAEHIIAGFLATYPKARHITYDTASCSAILQANELTFGIRALPSLRIEKTSLIVSFGADFLGTWISPIEFTAQYAALRKMNDNQAPLIRHIQFETGLSLTGTNADDRFAIKPSEEPALIAALWQALNGQESSLSGPLKEVIAHTAKELNEARGKCLVVSGSNNLEVQLLVNHINNLLGNYGGTIDLTIPSHVRKGVDADMIGLTGEMNAGRVDALLVINTNPAYHYPEAGKFVDGLKKTALTVSLATSGDETANLCGYVCPSNHYLESWGDAMPMAGQYALQQPLINPIFQTRQWEESLLRWSGRKIAMQDALKEYWEENLQPLQTEKKRFYDFWVNVLQQGIFSPAAHTDPHPVIRGTVTLPAASESKGVEVELYQPVAIATGRHANNPWLQEMPDPVTKAVWENYAAISPKFAAEQGLEDFDVIEIQEGLAIPVLIQPGQAYGTLSVAMGFGRQHVGKVADGLGVNVFPLSFTAGGTIRTTGREVNIVKKGLKHTVARSQIFGELEGKAIVRETTLDEYRKNPEAGNEMHREIEKKHVTLYDEPKYDGFHWGLSVDLNSCTGCGACLIACQAENNIPVVGKAEVAKFRIMHWIRIDRYYKGDPEKPAVVHQPVMCMQCDNAPCENVCPVSATPHNNEGLNQVAYTRCIGTKYCINNCPYKVRKFNWFQYAENPKFNYHENSDLGRLVLNPDVTVRERGVVEKCSFCSQRIQEKKLQAKLENRVLDGAEVQPACVQSCPAKALVFGDLNNPADQVAMNVKNERNYYLLEELHTLPSVGYLTKIRNRNA